MPITSWSPTSWRERPIRQQPRYDDPAAVERALAVVRSLPPLVAPGEVDTLRARLAAASRGDAFLFQGGDCAERFIDCSDEPIENKLKILLQMSLVLVWGARMPVVRVGRIGGQYAKPRSANTELVDGQEVASYRGDHVNGFGVSERQPDPARLVEAHMRSAATLNYLRALVDGGFADLHNPHHWDLAFVRDGERRAEYATMVDGLLDALSFFEATGVRGTSALGSVELFASHEGLLLAYEEAHLRKHRDRWYDLSGHMLWIGDRTRQIDGAHVEFFRGIENPIGVKVGPSLAPKELVSLVRTLEPQNRAGRVTLITRYGADKVREVLPGHIAAIQRAGLDVLWSSDPMHGNTHATSTGLKTRTFDRILDELRAVFQVHAELGTHLGGVHFELTGDDVTECVGGPQQLSETDLARSYQTPCDPRLNYSQSLELAFMLAQRLHRDQARR